MGHTNTAVDPMMDGPMCHANTAVGCTMDGPMGHANTAADRNGLHHMSESAKHKCYNQNTT